jgi:hypothetical protein
MTNTRNQGQTTFFRKLARSCGKRKTWSVPDFCLP